MNTYLSELKILNDKWGTDNNSNKQSSLTRLVMIVVKNYERRMDIIKNFVKQTLNLKTEEIL